MQRQLILDREPHTFEFLIGEWALHRTVGTGAVMRAQIKALTDDLDSRPNLRIGIVALNAEFVAATPAFVIHDSSAVEIETVTGEVIATRPDDIGLAERTFTLLQNQAVYGDDARVLLTRALATHTDWPSPSSTAEPAGSTVAWSRVVLRPI
ncbi:Scr1 family TA system antitoxin-like transcriptional regulator [Nocardia salmonicida]|uniref:Scr1 family TA system antitoxin-like transcriptional regulator n=1 Tax=Nocardia salmonicida TaxID=53431 RepID=UPI003CF919AC